MALALVAAMALTACSGSTPGAGALSDAAPSRSVASTGTAVPVGSSAHSLFVDGVRRTFLVYRPASLPADTAVPLVVMIHGGGGSAAGAEHNYGWNAQADRDHFVVAYPDGLDHGWSVGGNCCSVHEHTTADVTFISEVVKAVGAQVRLDPDRIYATGISEGGMMSYRLACQTDLFAAIGPDSATLLGSCPSPHPLSVIHIHGTADTRIPYNGTPGSGVHHIHGPSVPALNAMWRSVDHCAAPRTSTSGVVTTSIATCPDNRGVELITIAGAGHQWPGGVCNRKCEAGAADRPSTAVNATTAIWQFFAAHPR